ncbi:MAG: ATP-binding protein [Planctomycetota bacterium]
MSTQTLHVLIVDDEEGMRLGAARALRDFTCHLQDAACDVAFTSRTVESGEEAVAAFAEDERPDIVLLDHKLPGISGIEVLEQLGERIGDSLVIMISAYANIETAVRATRQGAFDFLPKPFTPAELRYVVQKAAGRLVLARRARELAEQNRRVRFEFIRVLGHELKAPLGVVESYLDIIRNRTLGGDVEKYHQVVERSMVRLQGMRKLILDLLDMTRLESGQRQRELQPIDLRDIAANTIEAMTPQAAERGITIALHADAPVPFHADPAEIEMILNNLVSNAIKYNRDNGRVDITLATADGGVSLAVADTGIGMSEEETAKLFQEFVRIRNRKTKNILGSGLGLSILKRLVDLYDGHVEVASEPDVGTTFTVFLRPPEQPEPPESDAS